jgi:hypothetical protein
MNIGEANSNPTTTIIDQNNTQLRQHPPKAADLITANQTPDEDLERDGKEGLQNHQE